MWHNSDPTVGAVKPGGGMSMWKRPFLPSRKLSRPGRLVKALGHHTMQPIQTCSVPSVVVGDCPVKNDAREMLMSVDSKQKAWLEHYQSSACTNCQNQEVPGLPSSNIWKSW